MKQLHFNEKTERTVSYGKASLQYQQENCSDNVY